jgi:hypothetical protein
VHPPANLEAAQAVVSLSVRFKRGLSRHASKRNRPLSLREAEDRYPGSKRATIGRVVQKLEAANIINISEVPGARIGHPWLLADEEDEAIVDFVI